MTATLTFSLPEEQAEHLDAINGYKWKGIVCQILGNIRHELKYNNPPKEVSDHLWNMRGCIYQWMGEENLSID